MDRCRLGAAACGALVIGFAAACATGSVQDGVYRSAKGYRVALPSGDWTVAEGGRADLELRHRRDAAAMLAHASCEGRAAARNLRVLHRHLLTGLREPTMLERGEAAVNGRAAAHRVVEGRAAGGPMVRVETYVLKDARCVYDLVYAAAPDAFETRRADFRRFVESFATVTE